MKKNIEMTESAPDADEISPPAEPEQPVLENAAQAISQGKRHLLVRDYSLAVSTLAEGVRMLANQYGELEDELAEPYLLYGKALLYLAREEAGVLGAGVPGAQEEEDDDEGEEEEDESSKKNEESDKQTASEESKPEEAKCEAAEKEEKAVEPNLASDKEKEKKEETTPEESGTSTAKLNGEASTSGTQKNGKSHNNSDDEGEDIDEEDDDANSNLRIAWEVLELAKLIFTKRGPPGWKLLADTHRLLGEVSMEGGNQPASLIDLNACLDLLQKIEPVDPRTLAETHYQLGLAHSIENQFDESIEQFLKATSLLEERIKDLESSKEETAADEIKELKELLPEIQVKVADMKDFKSQATMMVIEKIKSMSDGSCSNGAGPSGAGPSSSSSAANSTSPKDAKPVSNISHLVRKKRKQSEEEIKMDECSPCKKSLPENPDFQLL